MKQWIAARLRRHGGALAVLAVAILLEACGSGSLTQARAANVIAKASNHALDMAVATYQAEGLDVVSNATTLAEARAAAADVRARWRPVWAAWEVYRLAFGAWSTALDHDDAAAAAAAVDAMKAGYCGFRHALPADIAAAAPLIGCPS